MRPLPDDNGGHDKKLHSFIWPLGTWKGRRLVAVPLEYLRKFVKRQPRKGEEKLWEMASREVTRRGTSNENIHVTEHAAERFTQRWAASLLRTQDSLNESVGVVSLIKRLFKKALSRGVTTKAEGNDDNNFYLRHGRFRWVYGVYRVGKEGECEYRVISVMPAVQRKNPPKARS